MLKVRASGIQESNNLSALTDGDTLFYSLRRY